MEPNRIAELADATAAFNGSVLMALVNTLATQGKVGDALVEHVDALIEAYFIHAAPGSPELRQRGSDYHKMLRHPNLPLARFKGSSQNS